MATPLTSSFPRISNGPLPKYRQLCQILLDLIDSDLGFDPVPSEREISGRFGVARMTVRQAVDQMVAEGRVYKVATLGAFVARGAAPGDAVDPDVVHEGHGAARPAGGEQRDRTAGADCRQRARRAARDPGRLPGARAEAAPAGRRRADRDRVLVPGGGRTPGLLDEPALLQVPRGTEVLRFQRRSVAAGEPLEYAVSTYRGDRYQLRVAFDSSIPGA